MKSFDFSRWAVVARKDDTGLGRMGIDVRHVLDLGYYFVCPSDRMPGQPPEGGGEFWLKADSSEEDLKALLARVDGIIFFEAYITWHPLLLKAARAVGVKTVCVPMWEWFRGEDPMWKLCDLFACPSQQTVRVVESYGWKNTVYLPWTVDLSKFSPRSIHGPARLFIHNAGIVDADDRKGTRETILAFKQVKRHDIRLVVRVQREVALPELDSRIEVHFGNLERPEDLYSTGDAAIQPSKMEGIGFMVLEAVCAGLPVITLDYPPMNEFVRQPEMRTKLKWFKRKAFPTNWVKHAYLRLPSIRDLVRKIEWCAENNLASVSAGNREWAESVFAKAKLQTVWRTALSLLFSD